MDDSRLLIIPYFERVTNGSVKDIYDVMIDIQLNAPVESIYLAYEDGRVGVVTVCPALEMCSANVNYRHSNLLYS